jgi:hypothetical protein
MLRKGDVLKFWQGRTVVVVAVNDCSSKVIEIEPKAWLKPDFHVNVEDHGIYISSGTELPVLARVPASQIVERQSTRITGVSKQTEYVYVPIPGTGAVTVKKRRQPRSAEVTDSHGHVVAADVVGALHRGATALSSLLGPSAETASPAAKSAPPGPPIRP